MLNNKDKSAEAAVVEFEDAVALTGYGRYNIALLLTCGGCLMAVIMETMSMSYILPAAQCDLDLTLSEKGILSAISFLGVVLSSHLWGFIGDTAGRRKLILYTTYTSFLMGVLSSLSPFVWTFIVLRFLNGFFIGGASAVIYAYLGEFHNDLHRAKVLSWAATFVALATIALPGLAWLILPMQWSFPVPLLGIQMRAWRLLIIIYGLPSLIFATGLLQFPESPKFLWVNGNSAAALEVLRNLYVTNTRNPESMYPVRKLAFPTENTLVYDTVNDEPDSSFSPSRKACRLLKSMWSQTAPLFRVPLLIKTFMTSSLQFGVFASSSGFLMWMPDILNKVSAYMAIHPNESVMICTALNESRRHDFQVLEVPNCSDVVDEEVFKASLILGAVFALTYMFLGCVINITGKKLLLVILLLCAGLGGLAMNFVEGYTMILITAALFLVSGTAVSVINTVVVDLFPTQYRAMAMAISLMMGRFGAVTGSHIVGYLLEFNCSVAFYLFGGENIVLLLVALLLPIPLFRKKETKAV